MAESIKDIIDITGYPTDDNAIKQELVIGINSTERALSSIAGLNEDADEVIGAVTDLIETAGNMSDVLGMRTNELIIQSEKTKELLSGIDELVDFIPHKVIFDTKSNVSSEAPQWLSDNAEDDYHTFVIMNAQIIIFNSVSDWTLFKVRFSV